MAQRFFLFNKPCSHVYDLLLVDDLSAKPFATILVLLKFLGKKCIYCVFRELCDATSCSFSCFLVKFLTSQLDSKRKIEEFQRSLLLAVCKSWRRHNIEEVLVFADMPSFELYICLLISLSIDIWLFASMFFWNENIF